MRGAFRRRVNDVALLTAGSLVCGAAWGHVAFTAPAPAARLVAGSVVASTWVDTISHQTTACKVLTGFLLFDRVQVAGERP